MTIIVLTVYAKNTDEIDKNYQKRQKCQLTKCMVYSIYYPRITPINVKKGRAKMKKTKNPEALYLRILYIIGIYLMLRIE